MGGPFGSNLLSRDYTPTGVPVIRGQNLSVGQYVGGDFVFVSEEKADSLSANLARPGDLVFTQRGNAVLNGGQVALVPSGEYERFVVSQSQMKLSVDCKKADASFLFYVFKSPDHEAYLRNNAIVTGVHATLLTSSEYGNDGVLAELECRREFAPGHGFRAVVQRLQLCRQLMDVGHREIQDCFAGERSSHALASVSL